MNSTVKPRLYLDLDDTCFRTYEAWPKIWSIIAEHNHGIVPEKEAARDRLLDFYVFPTDGGFGVYDFYAHLGYFGITDSYQIEEVFSHIKLSSLAKGELEYSGLGELVDYARREFLEVTVLTYGLRHVQELKMALMPSLKGVRMVDTLGSKADYFKDQGITNAWMIDDKPIGSELPDGVRFIQASLRGENLLVEGAKWPVATSLDQVRRMLSEASVL